MLKKTFFRSFAALLALCLLFALPAQAEDFDDFYDDGYVEEEWHPDPLKASISASATSVLVGQAVKFPVKASGGIPPYAVQLTVTSGGAVVDSDSLELWENESSWVGFTPNALGVYQVKISLTAEEGGGISRSFTIAARQKDSESREHWEKTMQDVVLTGSWTEDLLAIARTQLGYEESGKDFIVDSAGKKQGFTRYGAWCSAPYAEWCAVFVGFCLHYAGVPESVCPWDASCPEWVSIARERGEFEEPAGYVPQPGDLVFLREAGEKRASHMGIVETVAADEIGTIEGNASRTVARRSYAPDSEAIYGYISLSGLAAANAPTAAAPLEETAAPQTTDETAKSSAAETAAPAATIVYRASSGETATETFSPGMRFTANPAGGTFPDEIDANWSWDYSDSGVCYSRAAEGEITLPDPARPGYTFLGWQLEGAVFTAQWENDEPIVF